MIFTLQFRCTTCGTTAEAIDVATGAGGATVPRCGTCRRNMNHVNLAETAFQYRCNLIEGRNRWQHEEQALATLRRVP